MSANYQVLQDDVRDALPTLPRNYFDCCVTSPPYWKLRKYLPKGHPLEDREIGQEPTPAQYVKTMVGVCGMVRDCLTARGTLWLNVGDTYAGGAGGRGDIGNIIAGHQTRIKSVGEGRIRQPALDIAAGNLCLVPQRLMIALQDDGWFVRSVVVWHKPAPMPCSVTGWMWKRCRKKVRQLEASGNKKASATAGKPHAAQASGSEGGGFLPRVEWADCPGCKKCKPNGGLVLRKGSWRPTSAWEPIIMLAKTANYFADGEPTKTAPAASTIERDKSSRIIDDPDEQYAVSHDHETVCDDGANLRDVWTIGFEPLKEKHYAAYPSELVYRCLASGTSQEGYCDRCSAPFVRVVEIEKGDTEAGARPKQTAGMRSGTSTLSLSGNGSKEWAERGSKTRTVGWRPSCKCPDAKPRPGRVLDPFCGSGRTGIVARRLGLDFTGVELNPEYAAMGTRLIKADQPLFNEAA